VLAERGARVPDSYVTFEFMRAKTVSAILLASLLITGLSATSASAKTEVKTVPGEVVFAYGQRPGDPGNCSAIVFVKWADQPRTISARAIYTFKGQERSQGAPPPFNDTYEWVATYTVPPGFHWIQVSKGWADGPVANTCEGTSAKQRTLIGTVARVELTVELDPKLCTAAKATLAARSKTVNRLKAQLRKASTKTATSKLRKKLATAKVSRAKWVKRVGTVC
jgi:hypothetical protein